MKLEEMEKWSKKTCVSELTVRDIPERKSYLGSLAPPACCRDSFARKIT